MRCPKCFAETPTDALRCPSCKLVTPKGRSLKGKTQQANTKKKARAGCQSKRLNPILVVLVILGTIIISGLGSYLTVAFWGEAKAVDHGSLEAMIERVRELPSNEAGLTVEQCLEQKVKQSKDSGRLLELEGWNVKPLEGGQYLISFSFQEKENVHNRAEWIVDPANSSIVPQNSFATSVYNQ